MPLTPPAGEDTAALNVTDWPTFDGFRVDVTVVDDLPFSRVASDHFPVMIRIKAD